MRKKDYSRWTNKELIQELEKLEKRKKYGIVWESKPEKVAELCKEKLPVLEEDRNKEIKIDENKPINILIEGDNYHALSVLNYTHKGKIDVIYIDPPYNTGKKNEWKYNDHYVDKEDAYRHSKWLSFISKRLKLAKNLLNNKGVIIISIDDNELAQLKLLCDDIFLEKNLLLMGVVNRPSEIATNYTISKHEYFIIYSKKLDSFSLKSTTRYTISRGTVGNKDQTMPIIKFPAGLRCLNVKDGIYKETRKIRGSRENIENLDPIIVKNGLLAKPVRLKARWRSSNDMRKFFANDCKPTKAKINGTIEEIYLEGNRFMPQIKKRIIEKIPSMILDNKRGSKDLEFMGLNEKFDFPKSVAYIKKLLSFVTDKSSIVLDFFAGSGTTGHAVLELNKEDGGNRRFILVTNNENNICTDVCYPRIEKVIKGYKNLEGEKVEGLGGNLKYFKTDFVDAEPTDLNKKKMVDKSTEMLCLKEDCFDVVKGAKYFRIFKNPQGKYLGIIYDDEGIEPFKKEIKKLKKKFVVYVFSLDESAREEEFEDVIEMVELKPIPAVILNVYKRIFK